MAGEASFAGGPLEVAGQVSQVGVGVGACVRSQASTVQPVTTGWAPNSEGRVGWVCGSVASGHRQLHICPLLPEGNTGSLGHVGPGDGLAILAHAEQRRPSRPQPPSTWRRCKAEVGSHCDPDGGTATLAASFAWSPESPLPPPRYLPIRPHLAQKTRLTPWLHDLPTRPAPVPRLTCLLPADRPPPSKPPCRDFAGGSTWVGHPHRIG